MKGQTLRETISVKVDGQRTIKLTTDELPILSSLQPILVIIPAKKYLTNGAIFEHVAREASARGIFVVRFDWSFPFEGLNETDERAKVKKDIETIFAHLKKNPRLDHRKMIVLAKSFGATIYSEDFYKKDIQSLFLLTPNCDEKNSFEKRFSKIYAKKIPISLAISKDDPYCDIKQIQDFMKKNKNEKASFAFFTGDHNFEGEKSSVKDVVEEILKWTTQIRSIPEKLKDCGPVPPGMYFDGDCNLVPMTPPKKK